MVRARRDASDGAAPRLIEKNIERVGETVETLQEEARKLQKRLVTRGRRAEREGVAQFNRIIRDFRKTEVGGRIQSARKEVEKAFREGVAEVLKVLHVPTKREVDALSRKISALEKEVAAVRRAAHRAAGHAPSGRRGAHKSAAS
jgi:poly(hydroxyalkanoate) granule-associated protein